MVQYGDPGTRARILDAAWALIDAGAEVTMAAVARRAGVSRQAVYLHAGDRSGLLVALVDHIDRSLGLEERADAVFAAPSGVEALERLIALHAEFSQRIINVTRVLDAARRTDADAAAAWEDRMAARREVHSAIIQRIADEGQLADGWNVDTASTLTYAVTLPRLWDELVVERGWSIDRYRRHLTALLLGGLVRAAARDRQSLQGT